MTLSIALVVAGLPASIAVDVIGAPPAAAVSPGLGAAFDCTPATIYGVASAGTIYSLDTASIGTDSNATSVTASTAFAGGSLNALGITDGGSDAYAIQTTSGDIEQYDAVGETWTHVGTSTTADEIKGAVDPLNGDYYFGTTDNDISMYDPTSNTVTMDVLTVTAGGSGGNGDLAFDKAGDMYLVSSETLSVLTEAQVAAGGSVTAASISTSLPVDANGVTFNSVGYLYIADNAATYRIDPGTGTQSGVVTTQTAATVDLASCTYNPTLILQKNVTSRFAPTDQFNLSITGDGLALNNTATTTGSATGVQAKEAGPVPALASTTYTFSETAASGSLSNYTTTYGCIDTADGDAEIATSSISTTSFTVNLPPVSGAYGQQAVCTFTNTPVSPPTLQVTKALGGSRFASGDQFTTQIRTGSASGPVVNATTDSTTTGSGSTVTPGTGTTGVYTATAGTTYYVTEAPAGGANLANYTSTITCTDSSGLQPGLPNNAAFSGSISITPVNNAVISCTLTNTPVVVGLTVVKSSTTEDIRTVGQVVPYSFLVTNTGTTVLTSITVTDTQTAPSLNSSLSAINCPSNSLAAGTNETCTATYTVTSADLANGSLGDSATATGTPPSAVPFTSSPSPLSIPVTGLTIVKSANPTVVSAAGQTVDYSFLVTNTGTTVLTSITVTDTQTAPSLNSSLSAINCPSSSLAAGAHETCTATYTVTSADIANGSVNDSATATGTPPSTVPFTSTPSVATVDVAGLTVVKSSTTEDIRTVGQVVPYAFLVTNTGTTVLTSITVTDTQTAPSLNSSLSAINCPSSSLAAGAHETCTATYTVTSADLAHGSLADSATATGTPPSGPPITSPASPLSIPVTGITIVKSANPTVVSAAGQTIDYSFLVTNTGTTVLTSITVTDTQTAPSLNSSLSAINCPSNSLAAGAHETCTATYTVTSADVTHGSVNDSATATGTPPSGTPITSSPSAATVDVAGLTVVKSSTTEDIRTVGQVVPYSFLVTNTGTTVLTSITVTDTQTAPSLNSSLSAINCPSNSLAAGTNETCTATYTVTAADLANGSLADSATATGTPPSGPPITSPASPLSIPVTGLTIVKSANPTVVSAAGQTVDYSFLVTNTGTTVLTSITVTDTQTAPSLNSSLSAINCPSSSLAAGAHETCTATYTVTSADIANGSVNDSATATGTPPSTVPFTSTPSVATVDVAGLTVVKSSTTEDIRTVGQVVPYAFLVTNTGTTVLTSITVTDTQTAPSLNSSLSAINCPSSSLAAGAHETCTATYTVTSADLAHGSLADSATATGTPPSGPPITSPASPLSIPVTGITIVKSANPTVVSAAGQTIDYSFLVTNTGTTVLTSITVTDTQTAPSLNSSLSAINCPSNSLAAGAHETCTATYTVTSADVTHGSVNDSATATGTPPSGTPITSSPSAATVDVAGLTVVKSSTTEDIRTVGQVVPYSFLVTNTGTTVLTSITVTDTQTAPSLNSSLSAINCPSNSLAAGTNETCTATYTVTAADLANGSLADSATATGTPPSGPPITSPASPLSIPVTGLTIVKSANPTVVSAAGQTVDYSFLVTNTGTTVLTSITVTDTQTAPSLNSSLSAINCPSSSLAAGAHETCTATYTVTSADIANGSVNDSATATGTPPSTVPFTSTPSVATVDVAGLTVVKSSTTEDIRTVGQVVPYAFLVTNTGTTVLTSITVTDTQTAPSLNSSLSAINCPSSSLAAGAHETCTATYTVTSADLAHGSLADSATATGTPPSGPPITSPASPLSIPVTGITIVKSANPTVVSAAGQTIDYSFLVTNTGTTVLTSITVTDTQTAPSLNSSLSAINCPSNSLAAGAHETCTATYTVTSADVTHGSVNDSATATGTPPSGTPITSSPSAVRVPVNVPVPPEHPLTVTKTTSTTKVTAVGQQIHYSFLVVNGLNVTLTAVTVVDTQADPSLNSSLSDISCPSTTLAPGASMTCTAVYTTTAADVANGFVADSAVVMGTPPPLPNGQPSPPITSDPSTAAVPATAPPVAPAAQPSPITPVVVSVTG